MLSCLDANLQVQYDEFTVNFSYKWQRFQNMVGSFIATHIDKMIPACVNILR